MEAGSWVGEEGLVKDKGFGRGEELLKLQERSRLGGEVLVVENEKERAAQ